VWCFFFFLFSDVNATFPPPSPSFDIKSPPFLPSYFLGSVGSDLSPPRQAPLLGVRLSGMLFRLPVSVFSPPSRLALENQEFLFPLEVGRVFPLPHKFFPPTLGFPFPHEVRAREGKGGQPVFSHKLIPHTLLDASWVSLHPLSLLFFSKCVFPRS